MKKKKKNSAGSTHSCVKDFALLLLILRLPDTGRSENSFPVVFLPILKCTNKESLKIPIWMYKKVK